MPAAYTLLSTGAVRRASDGAVIVPDLGNPHYLAFLSWRDAGNEPAREEATPGPIRRIASLAFRRRLSPEQQGAITVAAARALAAEPPDPRLQVFMDNLSAARVVELDNPETQAGVGMLEAVGLIDADTAARLLADGTPAEAPDAP